MTYATAADDKEAAYFGVAWQGAYGYAQAIKISNIIHVCGQLSHGYKGTMMAPAALEEFGKPATRAGFLAWIAWRFALALSSQASWPLPVDLLAKAVLAAGFCGYMAGEVRPNAFIADAFPGPEPL